MNKALNDTVRRLYSTGASFREIAEATGSTRSAIAGRCDRLGLKGRGPTGPRSHTQSLASIALDERIRAFAEQGLSAIHISERTDLTPNAVHNRLRKMGMGGRRMPRRSSPRRTVDRVVVVEPVVEPIQAPDPATAIAFTAATGCRYALWSGDETDLDRKRVCGGSIAKGSYCAFHASLVYVPYSSRKAA